MLMAEVEEEEVKGVIWNGKEGKSPSTDSFTLSFFKAAWEVVGKEVIKAVRYFFKFGKLMTGVNATFISLIPKKLDAINFGDYRPISLCNLLYKFITKIMANRLSKVIKSLVRINQTAFIQGRSIVENVLMCHEVVRGFERKNHSKVVILKIDIRKTYDSVSWDFVKETMVKMNFSIKFVEWMMKCITKPRFSVLINGSPKGFFHSTRGLRQGDPISPLLFCLVMECFSVLLEREVHEGNIALISKCRTTNSSHLVFPDDLMIFSRTDVASLIAIKRVLNIFADYSRVHVNKNKSTQIFACVNESEVQALLRILDFNRGKLPMRYLGVPVISGRLLHMDCSSILESIKKRLAG